MKLKILPKVQQTLWAKLAGVKAVAKFYLAGGTAVALHLEHRESIDFDFFSALKVIPATLEGTLKRCGRLEIIEHDPRTFLAMLDGVKISFFIYPYQTLDKPQELAGIKVAALSDLAAMKIIAISQRGTKKDFVDLHAILKSGWNFEAIFDALERKFGDVNYNKLHLLKSLSHFTDAESDPMPKMRSRVNWNTVKADLDGEIKRFLL